MGTNVIYNRSKIERPVDFSGLPHVGNCSPSDIDAPPIRFCMQIERNKKYLIGDFKEEGKEFPVGQRILLAEHVKAFRAIGYQAAAFFAYHPAEVDVIDAATSVVVFIFKNTGWYEPENKLQLVDKYCTFFGVPVSREITDEEEISKAFGTPVHVL